MVTKETVALQGIEYIVDTAGKRKAVVVDLERWGDLWEDFYKAIRTEAEQTRQPDENPQEQALLQQQREQALERLKSLAPAGITFPMQPLQKAHMPTIQVEGKPLSQIIIEDRR